MPAVEKLARQRFAGDRDKEEKTQSAVALAWQAYRDLVEKGKRDRIFPSRLADFAGRQVRDGRMVGGSQSGTDVLSPKCQRDKEFTVTRFASVYDLPTELHEALGQHDRPPHADQIDQPGPFVEAWPSRHSSGPKRPETRMPVPTTSLLPVSVHQLA